MIQGLPLPILKQMASNPKILGPLLISVVGAQNANQIMNALSNDQIPFDDVLNILVGSPISSVVSQMGSVDTPDGVYLGPTQEDLDRARKESEILNKPTSTPIPEEKKVTVDDIGFTQVDQTPQIISSPIPPEEKVSVDDIGFTAAPAPKIGDMIMTILEPPENPSEEEKEIQERLNNKMFKDQSILDFVKGNPNVDYKQEAIDKGGYIGDAVGGKFWAKYPANPFPGGETTYKNRVLTYMKPEDFLKLAEKKDFNTVESKTAFKLYENTNTGLSVPFLNGNLNEKGQIEIDGHEGRHRAEYVRRLDPDTPIPVYITVSAPSGQEQFVNQQTYNYGRSLTEAGDILLNADFINEEGNPVDVKILGYDIEGKKAGEIFEKTSPTSEQSFSDLVDIIEEPTQEIVGQGIQFPKEKTDNNLRLHTDRIKKIQEGKTTTYPGGPLNDRIVLKAPNESLPDIAIGNINFDDWKNRVEKTMSPDEILEAAKWYKKIYGEFDRVGAKDEKERNKLVNAWLSGQINESPTNALTNVLYVYEQMKQGVPFDEIKGKGLPDPTNNIKNILFERVIDKGVGAKISDFTDAGLGKNVRSFMGNDAAGGQPFVVDVHTARDTGLVDETFLNKLRQLGYKIPKDVKLDFGKGGITGTKYENRAIFGNELTKHLNEINWLGKSDWIPAEIQAIGWMNLTEMYGELGTSGDITMALERNTRRIDSGFNPSKDSPIYQEFGEAIDNLDSNQRGEIVSKALEMVNQTFGTDFSSAIHATGGTDTYQNPTSVQQMFSSKENAFKAAAMLGYLLNQPEVWVNSTKELTKNPQHLSVDLFEIDTQNLRDSATLKKLFDSIVENDENNLFTGYHPIESVNGQTGIKIIIDRDAMKNSPLKTKEVLPYIQSFLTEKFPSITQDLDFSVQPFIMEVELEKIKNDWSIDKNGESFKAYFSDESQGVTPLKSWSDIGDYFQELKGFIGSQIGKIKKGSVTEKRRGGMMSVPEIPSLVNGGLVDINYLTRPLNNGR